MSGGHSEGGAVETDLERRLAALSLEDKVSLLTGRDHWRTNALAAIGLRSLVFSDGPAGVRGQVWDERHPSLSLPSATVLAATWDEELARGYGEVLAGEARRHGVDVVLGPTVNMHRSPLAGRHFEAFSEDPLLTARLGAAVVRGLQRCGVGATVKHYVANDFETERFTASVQISERALREVYLYPFEVAVKEGGAWAVMSAYNAVNGVTCSESPLLGRPLKHEWGFEGVVVSDWSAVRSLEAAAAEQDLVMPGPDGPWGDALVQQVRSGEVDESVIDDKVRRLLLLGARVGAVEGLPHMHSHQPQGLRGRVRPVPEKASGLGFARRVAEEGSVLLVNRGLLPLRTERLRRLAVVGHNAIAARTQGGGSATVLPTRVTTPLEGLRAAMPATRVDHALGAVVQEGVAGIPLEQMRDPGSGQLGVWVTFRDSVGAELHREHRLSTDLVWFGGDAPVSSTARVDLEFTWVPERSGEVRLGFAAGGRGTVEVDGELVVTGRGEVRGPQLGASPLAPPSLSGALQVSAGEPRWVSVQLDLTHEALGRAGLLAIRVGLEPDRVPAQVLIQEAVAAASAAEIAVVVVGTSSDVESEGFDRSSLALPGAQDELVSAVAATGTPTVVVVNSGAPVRLPWRDQVDAILVTHFAGQEMGSALAAILSGKEEPGGRLATTWPAEGDPPVLGVTPVEGRLEYSEGIHIGYRAWLRSGLIPAFSFGHGLGYTTWSLSDLEVCAPRPSVDGHVRVRVENTGYRPGKQVVQVYLAREDGLVERPVMWLAGHAVVRVGAGWGETSTIALPWRVLAHWDDGWQVEPGRYEVLVGTSASDLPLRDELVVEPVP